MPCTGLGGIIALLHSFDDVRTNEEAEMNEKQEVVPAEVGDLMVIRGHHVGDPERIGEILEVSGDPSRVRCRVRWDDGHESTLSPGSDAIIRHARGR
jgi:hypothetical protein